MIESHDAVEIVPFPPGVVDGPGDAVDVHGVVGAVGGAVGGGGRERVPSRRHVVPFGKRKRGDVRCAERWKFGKGYVAVFANGGVGGGFGVGARARARANASGTYSPGFNIPSGRVVGSTGIDTIASSSFSSTGGSYACNARRHLRTIPSKARLDARARTSGVHASLGFRIARSTSSRYLAYPSVFFP